MARAPSPLDHNGNPHCDSEKHKSPWEHVKHRFGVKEQLNIDEVAAASAAQSAAKAATLDDVAGNRWNHGPLNEELLGKLRLVASRLLSMWDCLRT